MEQILSELKALNAKVERIASYIEKQDSYEVTMKQGEIRLAPPQEKDERRKGQ